MIRVDKWTRRRGANAPSASGLVRHRVRRALTLIVTATLVVLAVPMAAHAYSNFCLAAPADGGRQLTAPLRGLGDGAVPMN